MKADTITLELTSTMQCAVPDFGISQPIIVQTNVGVVNIAPAFENLELFPNPNSGSFTVKSDYLNGSGNVTIDIVDPIGQVIYTSRTAVQNSSISKTIDIKDIAAGVYLLRVSNEGTSKALRFTVSR